MSTPKKTAIDLALEKANKVRLSSFEHENSNEILLLGAPKEDLSILENIGMDFALNKAKKEKNNLDALVALETIYKNPVYMGEDIRELCDRHNLRFLPASNFKGQVDVKLAQAIRNFTENAKSHVATMGYESYFLLAPEECFFDKNIKTMDNCTLFYREENRGHASEGERFIKVYSWGENYDWTRRFNFLFSDNNYHEEFPYAIATWLLLLLTLTVLVLGFIFKSALSIFVLLSIMWGLRWMYTSVLISNGKFGYMKAWNQKNKKV